MLTKVDSMTAPNKSELESWLFEDGEDTQDGNGISPDESRRWLLDVFPEESLRLPRAADQHPTLNFENPYLDGIVKRHPTLRKSSYSQDPEGVNGYIKFRLQAADFDNDTGPASRRFQQPTLGKHHRSPLLAPPDSVPKLPLGFGKGLKLDKMDSKLLTFCKEQTAISRWPQLIHKQTQWHSVEVGLSYPRPTSGSTITPPWPLTMNVSNTLCCL
jgi:hypothetical protein